MINEDDRAFEKHRGADRNWRAISSAISVALLADLLFGAIPARAEASASALVRTYDGGNTETKDTIKLVLSALYDGLDFMNSELAREKRSRVFCPPLRPTLANDEILDMLRLGIYAHPEWSDQPYGLALLSIAKEKFPCKSD